MGVTDWCTGLRSVSENGEMVSLDKQRNTLSISSFTNKIHYLSKDTIIGLLPQHVSTLLYHLQEVH